MTATREYPDKQRMWICPNCGIRATMPIDSPLPIRCCCGLVAKDYSHTEIIDFDPTKRKVITHRPAQKPVVKVCQHRSEEFRLEPCTSCRGNVQVKVFKCDLHGECTVAKEVDGVHVCDGWE